MKHCAQPDHLDAAGSGLWATPDAAANSLVRTVDSLAERAAHSVKRTRLGQLCEALASLVHEVWRRVPMGVIPANLALNSRDDCPTPTDVTQ